MVRLGKHGVYIPDSVAKNDTLSHCAVGFYVWLTRAPADTIYDLNTFDSIISSWIEELVREGALLDLGNGKYKISE